MYICTIIIMSCRGLFSNMFTATTYNKIYVHNHSLIIETLFIETVYFELYQLTTSKLSNYLIVNILLSCSITTCKAMANFS